MSLLISQTDLTNEIGPSDLGNVGHVAIKRRQLQRYAKTTSITAISEVRGIALCQGACKLDGKLVVRVHFVLNASCRGHCS